MITAADLRDRVWLIFAITISRRTQEELPNSALHPTVRLLRASLRSALAARPAGERYVMHTKVVFLLGILVSLTCHDLWSVFPRASEERG